MTFVSYIPIMQNTHAHGVPGQGDLILDQLLQSHLSSLCAQLPHELTRLEEGLIVMHYRPAKVEETIVLPMAREVVLFLFCMEGSVSYRQEGGEEHGLLDTRNLMMVSYPFETWELELKPAPAASLFFVWFSLEKLHALFGSSFATNRESFEVLLKSYRLKKHFSLSEMTPALSVCIYQLFNNPITEGLRKFYQKSKVMEFLTLYLNKPKKDNELEAACPFVNDEDEIARIKKAREIIEEQLEHPPGLKELARMVGTNEFKLKVGFKNQYGTTVFGYVSDLRMQKARELLEVKKLQIQEVAHQVGYTNTSHFIAAYKKKFGVTPKKYLKSTR
jgi:AraC-like DNA-binding protein